MTGSRDPWEDERLDAAFLATARRHQPPADLSEAVIEEVRRASVAPVSGTRWRGWVPAGAMALTAVIAIAVGAGAVVLAPAAPSAAPVGTVATAGPIVSAGPSPSPDTVHGLRVMDVPAAIAVRDAAVDARAIAVHGWLSWSPGYRCAAFQASSPIQPVCNDVFLRILRDPEHLVTEGGQMLDPTGPSIHVDLDDVDVTNQAPSLTFLAEITAVGHFDDPRSAQCPEDQVQACRDRFVVDQVVSIDGESEPISVRNEAVDGPAPSSTAAEIAAIVDDRSGGAPILSMRIRPAVDVVGFDDGPSPIVWVARVLNGSAVSEYVIFDGATEVFMVSADGPPTIPADPFPSEVVGLPVIDVEQALEVRERSADDTEIAVEGWFEYPSRRGPACISMATGPILEPVCVPGVREGLLSAEPDGTAIDLILPTPNIQIDLERPPVRVVLVGHFDDHRASDCPVDRRSACQDTFLVDALWRQDGLGLRSRDWAWDAGDPPATASTPVRATVEDVSRSVRTFAPEGRILSLGILRGADLTILEPATRGTALADEPWVWHVTVLDGDRTRTAALPDEEGVADREGTWTVISGDGVIPTTPAGG